MKKTAIRKTSNLPAKIGVLLMVVLVLLSAIAPMKASAHSAYLLTLTLNESDSRYEPMILYDREGWGQNHAAHREADLGYFGDYKYGSTPLPEMKIKKVEDEITAKMVEKALDKLDDKDFETGGTGNPHLIYSFPGYHGDNDYDATSKDLARAEWVSRTLVQSLNDAIAFVSTTTKKKPNKYELMYLGTNLANGGYHDSSFFYGGYTVKVDGNYKLNTKDGSIKNKTSDVSSTDGFSKITITKKGEKIAPRYFVSKVPKGYKFGQPMFDSIPADLQAKDEKLNDGKKQNDGFSEDARSLTWKHVVLQAHYSLSQHDISYNSYDEILKPSRVETFLTETGDNLLLGLRTMLGLHSFTELMLNEGTRGGEGYFLGIMPTSWMNSASILHWTSMALSWMLIMFALVRVLALRNLAAINVAKRVDMVDGIKNLIVVGFALMLFNPIFYAIANFNWLLVDVMKNTSNVTSQFGSSAPGGGLLSKLLINFAYLVIEIYFNFIYISRGIIVAILYGVGPLFVASLAFGGKYVQIFSNYVKELVGTIYMQTFHAVLVAFFATITIFGGVRLFEQLVVLFAFIPLTKFFREAIGVGGGIADIAGAGAFGAVGDMAKMGTKGVRQKAVNSRFGSGGKDTGGNAPTTQMKSASNFQNGSGGSGGGTMGDVDNSHVKPSLNLGKGGNITDDGGNAVTRGTSAKAVGKSMLDATAKAQDKLNDAMPGLTKSTFKAGLKASAGMPGLGGAIGMSAVGAGGVGQNMKEVTPMKPKSFGSTKNNMKDGQKKSNQKAPNEVFANSGYAGSEITDSQNAVNHKFRIRDENGANGLYDDYGISDVKEDGDNLVYEYDYNADTHSFNSGDHNGGDKALMMQDMHKVFTAETLSPEQEARKAHYTSQGIQSVTQNGKGRMEVTAKKGTGGVQGVGNTGGMYSFRKRNGDNGSINLLDAIEYADAR